MSDDFLILAILGVYLAGGFVWLRGLSSKGSS